MTTKTTKPKLKKVSENDQKPETINSEDKIIGIIRPISLTDGYAPSHWEEVHDIVDSVVGSIGYKLRIVSDSDEPGLIHQNIVQHLYYDEVVICDVSSHNPNVMFELGLRLAFDKPTIIIKDDATRFSFDTSGIEHIEYPKDLRFTLIENFKKKLEKKTEALLSSIREGSHPSFLKNYGKYNVSKLDEIDVSQNEYILTEIKNLKNLFLLSERKKQLAYTGAIIGQGRNLETKRTSPDIPIHEYAESKIQEQLNMNPNITRKDFHENTEFRQWIKLELKKQYPLLSEFQIEQGLDLALIL